MRDAEILDAVALADQTGQWDALARLGAALEATDGTLAPPVAYGYARALMERREYQRAHRWAIPAARALIRTGPAAFRVPAALTAAASAYRVGKPEQGDTWFREALRHPPTDPHQQVSQGHVRLGLGGAWVAGWRDTMAKDGLPDRAWPAELTRWSGGPTAAPVWVLHEQGLGDTVLMLRYVPLLATITGHRPVLVMPAPLVRWAEAQCGDVADVFAGDGVQTFPPDATVGCWTMDLPLACGTLKPLPPIPAAVPLAPVAGRVGVCWRGSTGGHANMERSTEAWQFNALRGAGYELVNLTLGADDASDLHLPVLTPADVPDLWATADLIATCAAVVTVDTGVAHLSATLGVPTHVLPPTVPDWRWGRWGRRSPWYPAATIHRRRTASDWAGAVASALSALPPVPAYA